jgi:multidrug efflux pump subunit AcrB
MNFSAFSIRNPIPAILLFVVLTVAGLYSFSRMPVQDAPDIDFPYVIVTTSLPGASPPQLETEVARKIEGSVATVSDVRHIYTTISDGLVQTTIEFRLEKDIEEGLNDVRDAVNRVRSEMPPAVRDPVFSKATTSGEPILNYTVTSDRLDEQGLSWFVDDQVSKSLLAVKGVGKVTRVGGLDREVLIELDLEQMQALHVSAADISRQLQRVQQEAAGGLANVSGARQAVRTIGTVGSVAEIAALEISLPDGTAVRLDQVARVRDANAERSALALLDGKPVVSFQVSRSKGASEVTVARAVRAAVAELQAHNPHVRVTEAFNTVDTVEENYRGSMDLLYEGAWLSVIVVLLFLRDWRATLVSAAALPLSIVPTFLLMHWFGFSLNGVTLLSLALVVGILVDDAIVEIENIVRHLRMGKTPYQAALEAADEIGLAVIATTFTLVAVFLPTAFMDGIAGRYFKQFGWTAAVAVTASLVVARLLTPMMAAYLLRPLAAGAHADSPLMRRYLAAAAWCLRRRRTTMVLAAGFFVGSLALIPLLPTGFLPPSDVARTQVTLELAPGSTLEDTRRTAEQARALIMRDRDVVQVFSAIGGDDVRKASLSVML